MNPDVSSYDVRVAIMANDSKRVVRNMTKTDTTKPMYFFPDIDFQLTSVLLVLRLIGVAQWGATAVPEPYLGPIIGACPCSFPDNAPFPHCHGGDEVAGLVLPERVALAVDDVDVGAPFAGGDEVAG
jgi:hypothetical protein